MSRRIAYPMGGGYRLQLRREKIDAARRLYGKQGIFDIWFTHREHSFVVGLSIDAAVEALQYAWDEGLRDAVILNTKTGDLIGNE